MNRRFNLAPLALVLSLTGSVGAFQFDTIIVGGRPDGDPLGPELGLGIEWNTPQQAVINNSGQVGFQAELLLQGGVTATDDRAIWRWENGSKTLLAREGSQAAAFPVGVTDGSLSPSLEMHIDDFGNVLFQNVLSGTATTNNDQALTSIATDGTATIVAREGDLAPGLGFASFGSGPQVRSNAPGLSSNGKVVFRVRNLIGPGISSSNDDSLWYGDPGNASLLLREGDPALDVSGTAVFAETTIQEVSAAGNQVAIGATVNDGGESAILLAGTPGSLSPIAKSFEPAPGTSALHFLFLDPKVNPTGDVAFTSITLPSLGGYLYLDSGAGEQVISGPGVGAADTTEVFTTPTVLAPYETSLTKSGDLAFFGKLESSAGVNDTNDTGIWVHDDGITRLAIREGSAAPGLPSVSIGEIQHWAFNDQEDLLLVTKLTGNVTPGVDDMAMWSIDALGNLTKVLQTGDLFDVDPSLGNDSRTISSIEIQGIRGGNEGLSRHLALSDSRKLVFELGFGDGTSGLFTMIVPEPTSVVLLVLGALVPWQRFVR